MYQLRRILLGALTEGGLKLPPHERVDLTPKLVKQAVETYEGFLRGWNSWLQKKGHEPVKPMGPSGSSTHAHRDIVDKPDMIYGDVDYLVSVPVGYNSEELGDQRKADAASERAYEELLVQYLKTQPAHVDVALTLKGAPTQVVIRLSGGEAVQVDTVMTHPEHADWMKGRYTPERGIKGYVSGNLYKALGDALTLNIGTEGVLARMKGDQRVASNVRAGVSFKRVSNNFRTFLLDIARYLGAIDIDPLLEDHPGLDPEAINIDDLAMGIVGLSRTLDEPDLLDRVLTGFQAGLESNVDKKASRDLSPDKLAKLRKLNKDQFERVRRVFGL